jgi:hypothetical protein
VCGDNGKGIDFCVGLGICPRVVQACQRHDGFVFPAEAVPGMRWFGKMLFVRLKKMGCGVMHRWPGTALLYGEYKLNRDLVKR